MSSWESYDAAGGKRGELDCSMNATALEYYS